MSANQLAEQIFNAYNNYGSNPWLTFDGRPVPKWHELNDAVRNKWVAAAIEAQQLIDTVNQ